MGGYGLDALDEILYGLDALEEILFSSHSISNGGVLLLFLCQLLLQGLNLRLFTRIISSKTRNRRKKVNLENFNFLALRIEQSVKDMLNRLGTRVAFAIDRKIGIFLERRLDSQCRMQAEW